MYAWMDEFMTIKNKKVETILVLAKLHEKDAMKKIQISLVKFSKVCCVDLLFEWESLPQAALYFLVLYRPDGHLLG